jgi:L-fuculose-phosphate aldolase
MSRDARAAIVRYANLLHTNGWVANHDGNLSARLAKGRILITPTATSKADVDDPSLLVVNDSGERVQGTRNPPGEMALHLAIYSARPDVGAVIHAHPPYATAMACAHQALGAPFIAEAVVSLGPDIPLLPFASPKTPAYTASLQPFLPTYDAVMLANHGVLTWGDSLEQAFLRLELVEHLARVATLALPWGGPKPLPADAFPALLAARRSARLGPSSRGLTDLPAPSSPSAPAAPSAPPPSDASPSFTPPAAFPNDLTRIIAEEIANALLKP